MLPLVPEAVYQRSPSYRDTRFGAWRQLSRIVFGGFQTTGRFLLPDTIPGAVQQGIAAIPAKDRRLVTVVGDSEYVKHLVDTQLEAVIITGKCACAGAP